MKKKDKVKERQKIAAMSVKRHKARERMTLFSKKKNETESGNDTNIDQAKNKYPRQL